MPHQEKPATEKREMAARTKSHLLSRFLLALVVLAAQDASAASAPDGHYEGSIWSNGIRPATTVFLSSPDGVSGNYEFEIGDEIESGTLDACVQASPRNWRCEWRDAYGSGVVEMKFSKDYGSFDGVWSDEGNPPSLGLVWNGRRATAGAAGH